MEEINEILTWKSRLGWREMCFTFWPSKSIDTQIWWIYCTYSFYRRTEQDWPLQD